MLRRTAWRDSVAVLRRTVWRDSVARPPPADSRSEIPKRSQKARSASPCGLTELQRQSPHDGRSPSLYVYVV